MVNAPNRDRTYKVKLLMPNLSCLSIMSDTLWHLVWPLQYLSVNAALVEADGAQNIADLHILQLSIF